LRNYLRPVRFYNQPFEKPSAAARDQSCSGGGNPFAEFIMIFFAPPTTLHPLYRVSIVRVLARKTAFEAHSPSCKNQVMERLDLSQAARSLSLTA